MGAGQKLGLVARIAGFELWRRRRMVSSYIYALLYFAMMFLLTQVTGGAFGEFAAGVGSERVWANAPVLIYGAYANVSTLCLLITAAIFGQAVFQDFETRSAPLFFTTPITPRVYLLGRFIGALLFALALLLMMALGAWVGAHSPWVQKGNFGAVPRGTYLWPFVVGVLPGLLFTGGVFFALGALGKKMMPVYVGAVLMLVGYLIAGSIHSEIEHRYLAAIIDPFGSRAFSLVTDYWTPLERNTRLVSLTGALLVNRLLWAGVGVALLAFTMVRFSFSSDGERDKKRVDARSEKSPGSEVVVGPVELDARGRGQLWVLTKLSFFEIVKSVYFSIILLAGVGFVIVVARDVGILYGTTTYPVTWEVIDMVSGGMALFVLILNVFYAGELVWRERDLGLDQLLDATPLPTWKPFAAKLLALGLLNLLLATFIVVMGVLVQTFKGYFHYELIEYIKSVYVEVLIGSLLVAALSFTAQSVIQHKYLGHLAIVAYYVISLILGAVGLEHPLYSLFTVPSSRYSDMNGYGQAWIVDAWFDCYWVSLAVLMLVAARAFWVRGTESGAGRRRQVRQQFAGAPRAVAVVAALCFVAVGGLIYLNTNIRNIYRDKHDLEALSAAYEKKYRVTLSDPQPKITAVQIAVDIHPEVPSAHVVGHYRLRNKMTVPVATVWLDLPTEDVTISTLRVGSTPAVLDDRASGVWVVRLPSPLLPGAESQLDFDLTIRQTAFRARGFQTDVVGNGTFLNSGDFVEIGYREGAELSEDKTRKKYGLAPKTQLRDLDDPVGKMQNALRADSDFVTFDATLSTSPDQIAIAPGLLEREWSENGRHYFHYRPELPILDFFNISSARYAVRRDRWNDVALEIYYHPGHEYDLDAMMSGMKAALDYCTTAFGPYQAHVLRIVEFPRYRDFAQSFPNTIPYSEGIGFIARVDTKDPHDVDYPYYVTAHEVAHQWWAHQVVPAAVQGEGFVAETMAQYSALMVMKHGRTDAQMKRFLKYELDQYLTGRGSERRLERPLLRVEAQPYIYYRKGSVAMYRLQDSVGEAALNKSLHALVARVGGQGPPYVTARDLLGAFKEATPPELQYLLTDLIETITIDDVRAVSATAKKVAAGYEVHLSVTAKKVRLDDQGVESEVPMNDEVDVGATDLTGESLGIERRRIKSGESEIVFTVKERPFRAGIDPLDKLIDRKPDDNLTPVVLQK